MNILVLGSGGREHTLPGKYRKVAYVKDFVAPGNSGTSSIATNIDIVVTDFEAIKRLF